MRNKTAILHKLIASLIFIAITVLYVYFPGFDIYAALLSSLVFIPWIIDRVRSLEISEKHLRIHFNREALEKTIDNEIGDRKINNKEKNKLIDSFQEKIDIAFKAGLKMGSQEDRPFDPTIDNVKVILDEKGDIERLIYDSTAS